MPPESPTPTRRPPPNERTAAVFVRVPAPDAERLDRAAFILKAPKREIISALLHRYVDPDDPAALAALRSDGSRAAERRRVTLETDDASLTVGGHAFRPAEPAEVLDLEELAVLLRFDANAVRALAEAGELPGRRLGEQWRFSRAGVLAWLGGESARVTD